VIGSSNGYFRLNQIQEAAARYLGKSRMNISLEWVILTTFTVKYYADARSTFSRDNKLNIVNVDDPVSLVISTIYRYH